MGSTKLVATSAELAPSRPDVRWALPRCRGPAIWSPPQTPPWHRGARHAEGPQSVAGGQAAGDEVASAGASNADTNEHREGGIPSALRPWC